jgi:hypothetical protein
MKRFDLSFRKLLGKPCWGVTRGWGSFLTLEFGEPHLEIYEPRESTSKSKKIREAAARRLAYVRGDWHLWIYCCAWTVSDGSGRLVGNSSTKKSIDRAARFLNGQALSSGALISRGMRTVLEFDLGGRLETKPYDRRSEQWMLYEPTGKVLIVRADKRYTYGSADRTPDQKQWLPIQTP